MKIEILDAQSIVLAIYDAVHAPDIECADYIFAEVTTRTGIDAIAWREWVPPPPTLDEKRREKIVATKQEARRRIVVTVPELDHEGFVDLLRLLWPHLSTPASDPALNTAKNIAIYAKTKIDELKIADETTVDAYDPITDPNWPT